MQRGHALSFFPSQFDVLIVGGGLAGLMAALAALEKGASVGVVSLGPVGRSGNTAIASSGMATASNDPGNSPADFLNDLIRSGKGLTDTALATRLTEESRGMVARLAELGVRFRMEGSQPELGRAPGHSVPRNLRTEWDGVPYALRGTTYQRPLADKLEKAGVPLLNGLRVVELLRADGRITGVRAYERKSGTQHILRAGRVVLASGGYSRLYRRTNNAADSYGDGIAMALEAGALLRDMEMVQFYPTMMFSPVKMTLYSPLFAAGAVVRNRDHERFLSRYDPAGDNATRDAMARAIFLETRAGRGVDGCALLDCTAISEEAWGGILKDVCRVLAKRGLDPRRDFLSATPCAHYTLGGICIDEWGRTNVPGLYAAGEVCGGVHGSNRLGGVALMEAAVFGRQAGLAAATDSLPQAGTAPDLPPLQSGGPETRARLDKAMNRLRDLLWDHVSLVRDETGLRAAMDGITTLRGELPKDPGMEEAAFARTLLLAEAVAQGALLRAESRGAHFREDHPQTDEGWARPVLSSLENGRLHVRTAAAGRS